jgi:aspartate aminotransferase
MVQTHRGNEIPLASRLQNVQPSATARVFSRAKTMRAGGADLISFAVGEPDFDTPEHIREAAKRAIDDGASRYTEVAGIIELRRAICLDSLRRRAVAHTPEEVVVSVGVKHALFNLALALYEPGDEVVIPIPGWVSYPEQARLAGASPLLVRCAQEQGFLLSAEALRRAVTRKTKAVVLCTPSNPTGAAYSEAQLLELVRVIRDYDFWIIVDEIYVDLTYDGFVQRSLLQIAPDLRDRIALVDGVSKRYAMTGWRIGWLLAPERVARACQTIQSQATTNAAAVSQHAALAALTGPQTCIEQMRRAFEARRNRLVAGLNAIAGLQCIAPRGAFYAFANASGLVGKRVGGRLLGDDLEIAQWLLDEAKVAVVPGAAFGAPGYLRFSFAVSMEQIDEGINRVKKAVSLLG